MIRVVLDTNQIVSAIVNPKGLADMILMSSGFKGNQKYELVVTDEILFEIKRVLNYSRLIKLHGWSEKKIDLFLNLLKEHSYVADTFHLHDKIVFSDTEDDKFFHAAIQAEASYIVSRDAHLLKIKEYKGVKVLTPEVFISAMKNNAL